MVEVDVMPLEARREFKPLPGPSVPPMRVASLEQLDALVGRYVMDDVPEVYWEHTVSRWRFDSLSEALDALSDPFYSSLVPEAQRENLSVAEVREFPGYSGSLGTAIRVVELLGGERKPLTSARSVKSGRPISVPMTGSKPRFPPWPSAWRLCGLAASRSKFRGRWSWNRPPQP